MRIAVLDDYQDAVRHLHCFEKLDGHDVAVHNDHATSVGMLAERLEGVEALVLIRERTRITSELLDRLPDLRLISQRGSTPNIDIEACTSHGVIVSSEVTRGLPSYSTAELTWALVLASQRNLIAEVQALRGGTWQVSLGRSVRGKTLGIFGLGRIGTATSEYGVAFGMRPLVWGRTNSLERARSLGLETAANQRDLFERSDVLLLHVALNEETRGIVTRDDLDAMSPESLLVNTSRAGLIEPGALLAALTAGRPGRAAVDVFDEEPIGVDEPLLLLDNVICTPHLGYVEAEGYERAFGVMFDQVLAFVSGTPINIVNPAAVRTS